MAAIWKVGTIQDFEGPWTGIGTITIDGEPIPCETSETIRALHRIFGGVILADNVVNVNAFIGKRVAYCMDHLGLGMLGGLAPAQHVDMLNWEEAVE